MGSDDKPKEPVWTETRNVIRRTHSLYQADLDLLDFIAETIGCGKSEALRRAISSFAAHLAWLQGSREEVKLARTNAPRAGSGRSD